MQSNPINQSRRRRGWTVEERLWDSIDKSGHCWLWTNATFPKGQPQIKAHGKTQYARRVLWENLFGPIPDGSVMLSRCNEPKCMRPDHLYLGTRIEVNHRNTVEDFWTKVDRSGGESQCWNWMGGNGKSGYGGISISNKYYSAHRLSYELTYGPIPEGLDVLHHCDVKRCCNPAHLYLGTDADNNRDRIERGLVLRGESHPCAKLTAKDVIQIRSLYATGNYRQVDLGERFGVMQTVISSIVNRKSWKYLR